jgi:hypothetical protein
MLWEGKQLRDLREADIRRIVQSGLEEHLQLEYKSELYDEGERGRREFALDVCMFANTEGGILLLGIPERRDEQGQPTGVPDAAGDLGLELENPEAVLAGYDARVMEAIEERLPLESAAIDLGNGRYVLALRIPNSLKKPHSVRLQGHIYFPARRERQRYHMNVREIKELAMRATSRRQQAEERIERTYSEVPPQGGAPYAAIAMVPVFSEDFMVDVRAEAVHRAVGNFNRAENIAYRDPTYTFNGLERREEKDAYTVTFRRNGLLSASLSLPLYDVRTADGQDVAYFDPRMIDVFIRRFVLRSGAVYEASQISAPYLMGLKIWATRPLVGGYPAVPAGLELVPPIPARHYVFPYVQIDDISDTDNVVRPLCDQAHQMFGRDRSPSFNEQEAWTARYA